MEDLVLFKYALFSPSILQQYFQESVRLACKGCKRYEKCATCPPYIASIKYYNNLVKKFTFGKLVIKKYMITDIAEWKNLGRESSEDMRKHLIKLQEQYKNKFSKIIIFGAGSCKACDICTIPCCNIQKQIIPIEGLGINVIRLVKKLFGITIKFPVEKQGYYYRMEMILWKK